MAYAVEYEVPGNEHIYDKVKNAIGTTDPDGLVVHLVVKTSTGLRHSEVWESKQSWERFRDERVQPAVASVLSELGVKEPPAPPVERTLDIVDVWKGVTN